MRPDQLGTVKSQVSTGANRFSSGLNEETVCQGDRRMRMPAVWHDTSPDERPPHSSCHETPPCSGGSIQELQHWNQQSAWRFRPSDRSPPSSWTRAGRARCQPRPVAVKHRSDSSSSVAMPGCPAFAADCTLTLSLPQLLLQLLHTWQAAAAAAASIRLCIPPQPPLAQCQHQRPWGSSTHAHVLDKPDQQRRTHNRGRGRAPSCAGHRRERRS